MIYLILSLLFLAIGNYLRLALKYCSANIVRIKTWLEYLIGNILSYAVIKMTKHFNMYADVGFSLYQNQYIMLTKAELSGTPNRLEKNFEIKIFAKCVSEGGNTPSLQSTFSSIWMFAFGEYRIYQELKNHLQSSKVINDLGYLSISAMYSASIVFLLLDDSLEAFLFCSKIADNAIPPSMTAVFYILLNIGSYRMIRNWHIKMLAALHFITSSGTNNGIALPKKEIIHANIIKKCKTEKLEVEVMEDFARMWFSLNGKTSLFLSKLRMHFFIHICSIAKSLDVGQQHEYKVKIVSIFYDETKDNSYLTCLPLLTLVLKLFSDGLLHNDDQLQKFQNIDFHPVSSNSNLKLSLEGIKLNDSKNIKYSKISPHFNLLGGRRVHRGMCLIINQTFQDHPKLYRAGTEKDERDLKQAWEFLGCKDNVEIKRDLNKVEMTQALKSFRDNLKYNNPDYCVICILGHGNLNKRKRRDEVMDVNLEMVSMNKIKNMFVDGRQCPAMIGKPKVFFIQACRGNENQNMIDTDMSETDGDEEKEDLNMDGVKYINKSWFFVFQSTIKGFSSNRHPQNGTIFIQSLCKELMENGRKLNLSTIASSVNQRIMRQFHVQAPIYENQLGDFIYFHPNES